MRDLTDHYSLLPRTVPVDDMAQQIGRDRSVTEVDDVLFRSRDAVGDLVGGPAPPLASAVGVQPGGGHDRHSQIAEMGPALREVGHQQLLRTHHGGAELGAQGELGQVDARRFAGGHEVLPDDLAVGARLHQLVAPEGRLVPLLPVGPLKGERRTPGLDDADDMPAYV
ncbi:hypothetical protein ACFU96_23920 [Streptomyces sp. NPDC057620]|uniref:hypothetical protein n=1 Tax=Streptomyces sp. NPDC057620 TaxID=3346185 RepID=UPI0036C12678